MIPLSADSSRGIKWIWFGAAALLAAVGAAMPAGAQFEHLATTDGGSRLFFSSSLRMRGSGQFTHAKLFVADAAGVQLFEQREQQSLPPPDERLTNFVELIWPDVSGDGSVTAFTGRRFCFAGSGCLGVQSWESTFLGAPNPPEPLAGTARLSRNGRFASVFDLRFAFNKLVLVDLVSGDQTLLSEGANRRISLPEPGRRVVSSNGQVVFISTEQGLAGLRLGGSNGVEELPVSGVPVSAVIDDQAAIIVCQTHSHGSAKLVAIEPSSGAERVLVESKEDLFSPVLSHDGRLLLFLSNANLTGENEDRLVQIFVMNIDGSQLRQLTQDTSGIAEATLAGNGDLAYAVTFSGKILRIAISTGDATEVVGRSWEVFSVQGDFTLGSINRIVGRGFSESTIVADSPLPFDLGGVQVRVGGSAVPLLSVSPTEIRWQLPWETPLALKTADLQVDAGGGSLFEGQTPNQLPGFVRRARPRFERLDLESPPGSNVRPYPLAAHADLGSAVTPRNGARPGEIIHLSMTGLGPVDPPAATGEPGPSEPLASIVLPLRCELLEGETSQEPEVFFAGLAPGQIGAYRVSLRIPRETQSPEVVLRCTVEAEDVFEYDRVTIPVHTRPLARRGRSRSMR